MGAVVSQSGAHAELAAEYAKGLQRWRDEVNTAGGLLGRRVELRLLDDASSAARAAGLYARLIREDRADLLVGPYGSAATLVAAGETERARRVMVNGAGPAAAVHSRAPRYLFQTAVPYAAYGAGVLEIAAEAGYRRLFILARDDPQSREMAEATQRAALKQFSVNSVEIHRVATLDFSPQVARARAAQAEAWIAFGDVRDAAEMVKSFKRLDYAPALFFARGASHPRFVALVGQDAEWSLGVLDYQALPGAPVHNLDEAQGYVAGVVLAAGVRSAGTLDQERLRAALAELELTTMLGEYRVAPESGAQTGFKPVVVQVRAGLPKQGMPLLPYPQWEERATIQ
ncbi:MAG: ABC transporter substrate-binding protein [Burkholderiales bacterium]